MNPAAIPPLVSFILTGIMAVVAWTYRRERISGAFALFASGLALISLTSTFGLAAGDGERTCFWLRGTVLLGPLVLAAAIYHVLVLTGYIHRLDTRILGLRLRHYPWLYAVVAVVVQVIVQGTTLIVNLDGYPWHHGKTLQIHPLTVGLAAAVVYLAAVMFIVLYRSLKETTRGPRRTFLWLNALGVASIYLLGPAIGIGHSLAGVDGRPYLFVGYTLAAVIFYVAMLRNQFDRVDELTRELEHKVEQRTQHLEDAQARLVQSEKMAALGRLVAGVAHELNTPVGAIQSTNDTLRRNLDLLEGKVKRGVKPEVLARTFANMRKGHDVVEDGTRRVGNSVRRLREFAGLDRSDYRVVDLNGCVTDAVELVLAPERERIKVDLDLCDLPTMYGLAAEVNQVLQSLLVNATEAIKGEGTVSISTRVEDEHVVVSIEDTGPGIAMEHNGRVFEPGFTTKGQGVGTGLGLAIAYQVMAKHRGAIDVVSQPGEGTAVTLRFPVRSNPAPKATDEGPAVRSLETVKV